MKCTKHPERAGDYACSQCLSSWCRPCVGTGDAKILCPQCKSSLTPISKNAMNARRTRPPKTTPANPSKTASASPSKKSDNPFHRKDNSKRNTWLFVAGLMGLMLILVGRCAMSGKEAADQRRANLANIPKEASTVSMRPVRAEDLGNGRFRVTCRGVSPQLDNAFSIDIRITVTGQGRLVSRDNIIPLRFDGGNPNAATGSKVVTVRGDGSINIGCKPLYKTVLEEGEEWEDEE